MFHFHALIWCTAPGKKIIANRGSQPRLGCWSTPTCSHVGKRDLRKKPCKIPQSTSRCLFLSPSASLLIFYGAALLFDTVFDTRYCIEEVDIVIMGTTVVISSSSPDIHHIYLLISSTLPNLSLPQLREASRLHPQPSRGHLEMCLAVRHIVLLSRGRMLDFTYSSGVVVACTPDQIRDFFFSANIYIKCQE